VDRKGKTRKRYEVYLTPYEKLMRPGVTMAELEQIAQSHSRVRSPRQAGKVQALPFLRSSGYSTLTAHAFILIFG